MLYSADATLRVVNNLIEIMNLHNIMSFTSCLHIIRSINCTMMANNGRGSGLLSVGGEKSFSQPASIRMRVASWPPEQWTPKMVSDGFNRT